VFTKNFDWIKLVQDTFQGLSHFDAVIRPRELSTSLLSVLEAKFSQQIEVNNFSPTNLKFSAFRIHTRHRAKDMLS